MSRHDSDEITPEDRARFDKLSRHLRETQPQVYREWDVDGVGREYTRYPDGTTTVRLMDPDELPPWRQ